LKWTKDRTSKEVKKKWAALEEEMQFSGKINTHTHKHINTHTHTHSLSLSIGSFKSYRESLHEVTPPCIPYLGVHLQDLVFIEDGNPDKLHELINWRKRKYVSKIVSTLLYYQTGEYKFKIPKNHPEALYFLDQLPIYSEKELWSKSLTCEPKNASRTDIS